MAPSIRTPIWGSHGLSRSGLERGPRRRDKQPDRRQFVRDQLQDTAKRIAAKHSHAIEDAQRVLGSVTKGQRGQLTILSEDCQRTLGQQLQQRLQIAIISLAPPDGSIDCSATPSAQPVNPTDQPNFQHALAPRAEVIGEAIDRPTTGKRNLPFRKVALDSRGRVLGVIRVSLDLSGLAHEVAGAKYSKGARFGLIDAKGQVLAKNPDAGGWYRYRPASFFNKYAQVLATKTPLEEVFAFDAPGAERKWLRQHMAALEDGVAVSLHDITAWKTKGAVLIAGLILAVL